jgi:NAD(P)-dependent dehydrogenase (short-subunit alcohol dehydrogenase family)
VVLGGLGRTQEEGAEGDVVRTGFDGGIRINAVCPGMVNTPMAVFVTKNYDPEIVRRIVAQEPIGRFGDPEEIAAYRWYGFAARPRASWWVMLWQSMAASSPAN